MTSAADMPGDAPGTWWWRAAGRDRIDVRLQRTRGKLDVAIWWNRAPGRTAADVRLIFGLYERSVELGSLQGNGFDAPAFHGAGFGTLAVNVAVQALRRVRTPQTPIHGMLSNTAEEALAPPQRAALEENRRRFWRRFGLQVVQGGSGGIDRLRGCVGDLQVVEAGTIAGQFPRCPPLEAFRASAAAPAALAGPAA